MPRWYKRSPQRFREAVTLASRSGEPMSPNAVNTLSALVDFIGENAAVPDVALLHGGIPVDARMLVHGTHLRLRDQELALRELADKGFLSIDAAGIVVPTSGATTIPEYDDAAERQRRSRANRDGHATVTQPSRDSHNQEKRRGEERRGLAALVGRAREDVTPILFATRFAESALDDGALPASLRAMPGVDGLARREADRAEALLATYDLAEIVVRAERMIRRKVTGEPRPLNVGVSLQTLAERWDWFGPDARRAGVDDDDLVSRQLEERGVAR